MKPDPEPRVTQFCKMVLDEGFHFSRGDHDLSFIQKMTDQEKLAAASVLRPLLSKNNTAIKAIGLLGDVDSLEQLEVLL